MRFVPLVLLLFVMLDRGSGTVPAKPPAVSGGNQAQQQKVVTPEKQSAKTPAEKAPSERATTEKTPDAAAVKKHMTPAQLKLGDPVVNSIGMVLVPIPAGEFKMGSPASDKDAFSNEKPQHLVKMAKPYYLSAFEVTQQQYEKVMGSRPWQGNPYVQAGRPDNAANYVTHDAAVEFCRKLSKQEGVEYRLPTEAEWEYTCRAGTTTVFSFEDDGAKLGQYGWYKKNAWDVGERYLGKQDQ